MAGTIWTELKYGFRLIGKQPVVAATVILALAIGIGMATTGFTFLEAVLHGELPFDNGDRFVRLSAVTNPEGERRNLEVDRYRLLRNRADTLAYLGAIDSWKFNVLQPSGEIENVSGALLTPGWFRHLPYPPLAGRPLNDADGKVGAEPVAVIRNSFWERSFASDPAAIGSRINVNGIERTIVGVMPDGCEFPASGELWLPLESEYLGGSSTDAGPGVSLAAILAEGATLESAGAQLSQLSAQFDAARPDVDPLKLTLARLTDLSVTGIETPLIVGTGVLVMVLLLVAANVANLILARNASRSAELAVRTVLGASRGRVIGQLFVEVLVLGAIAAVLGLLASQTALRWIEKSIVADEFPFWISFTPSATTVTFVVLITLLASAVAGAWPAWKATRRDLSSELAAGGTRSTGVGIGRFGGSVIVAETALSVALLSGAVVMAWGFARYAEQGVDLPRGEILTAQLYVAPALDVTQEEILEAVARLPGVSALGAGSSLPRLSPYPDPVEIEPLPGEAATAASPIPAVGMRPGFFESLGGRVVSGRNFLTSDYAADAPAVAIVNQPFVDRHLEGRNPIGRRLRIAGNRGSRPEPWREIVGVVPDLGILVGDADRAAGYYVPMLRRPLFYLSLRTPGDPAQLAAPLRRALFDLEPEILVTRVNPLEEVGQEDRSALLVMSAALTGIGAAALGLSLVGMYAIISFSVARRTREIGIRIALGAGHRQILESVVGRAGLLLGIGAVIGGALALGMNAMMDRVLVSQLPDPGFWVFPGVALLLGFAGLLASWVPARRALRIQPTEALRHL